MAEVVHVLIRTTSGQESFEPLLMSPVDGGLWRLERSPLLVEGIAKGDVVRVENGGRSVSRVRSGGLYAVQVYCERPLRAEDLREVEDALGPVGGEVDAHAESVLSVSLPAAAAVADVRERLEHRLGRGGDFTWYVSREPDEVPEGNS